MLTWKIFGGISVVALLALVGLVATIAFASQSSPRMVYPGAGVMGWNDSGMMSGYGGMMGFGPRGGQGMMGPGFNARPEVDPLAVDDAKEAIEQYL